MNLPAKLEIVGAILTIVGTASAFWCFRKKQSVAAILAGVCGLLASVCFVLGLYLGNDETTPVASFFRISNLIATPIFLVGGLIWLASLLKFNNKS
jgi:hypothetical protein